MNGTEADGLAAELRALSTPEAPLARAAEVPVSEHAIRTWCAAVGETNPVYRDPDAAASAGLPGVVAPPAMLQTWTMPIGEPSRAASPSLHALVRAATRRAGLGAVVATDYEQEYFRPISPGQLLTERSWVAAVSGPKATVLGTGRFVTIAFEFLGEDGDPVGRLHARTFYFDPLTARPDSPARPAPGEPAPGEPLEPREIPLTRTLIIAASLASNDHEPVHHDHQVAQAQGLPDIIASIVTTAGLVLAYAGTCGPPGARPRRMRLRLTRPAVAGDVLRLGGLALAQPDGIRLTVHGEVARGRHVTAEIDLTPPRTSAAGTTRTLPGERIREEEPAMGQANPAGDVTAGLLDWRHYTHDRTLPDVLNAALDLFVAYGYHGTSVRAIATKAGLSVPGVYHHYRSKQEMLATLLRLSNDDVMRRAQAALAGAGDEPRARFVALVENIVLYMTYRRRLAHLAREIRCLDEPYRSQHIELRDELERMVLAEVTAAAEAGDFAASDPHEATRAVLVLCRGVADWYTPAGPMQPAEIAQRYVQFALSLVEDSR